MNPMFVSLVRSAAKPANSALGDAKLSSPGPLACDAKSAIAGDQWTGSAVVVSVLPLAGLVIVGAAGAVRTLTVNVSVAAVELGPPAAACVAVTAVAGVAQRRRRRVAPGAVDHRRRSDDAFRRWRR